MRIRSFNRINLEQIESQDKANFAVLINALNPFLEQFNVLFNKNIDFDNLKQVLQEAVVEVNSSGEPKTELILNKGILPRINGIQIVRVDKINPNDPFLNAAPFCEFVEFAENIKIKTLIGFPANKRYKITFLLF